MLARSLFTNRERVSFLNFLYAKAITGLRKQYGKNEEGGASLSSARAEEIDSEINVDPRLESMRGPSGLMEEP
jgi:hypothetical protein